jgi:hypothetical protein
MKMNQNQNLYNIQGINYGINFESVAHVILIGQLCTWLKT